ncbi:hypothetical protein COHA_005042 [Chlorella ohadii]|uniref:Mitochondrial carrier protein n=1 Tax=Chlorella ohadii TaxID=2649997 RepID=A0AAD5DRU0_9CHLO|nr:hypothetical protein COHA_005042 [Chlorella ohadii]
MALEGSQSGLRGAYLTARGVVAHDGVRGLYKGFGTVIGGMFPARMVYLSTLEMSKSVTNSLLHRFDLGDTAAVGAASFVGGAMASLSSQLIVVPIDVVAQRLMIMGGGPPPGGDPSARAAAAAEAAARHHTSGLALARSIVAAEGVRGLYRGFGASLAMFVPNSAIWWGSYGVWQQVLWHQVDRLRGHHWHSEGEILAVQGAAGILTGCTRAAVRPTWRQVASHLLHTEGAAGFFRGVAPRMASSSIWGTTMVCSYEWLKRLCARPAEEAA